MDDSKRNKIERLKLAQSPCDYFEKLSALEGSKLSEADRFYLKNFGIYNHKLTPDRFTLRLRILGGRLGLRSLDAVYRFVQRHGAEAVVTSRAQLELHGLDGPLVMEAFDALPSWGLESWQTYTDNFRNIVCDPLDGLLAPDVSEAMRAMEAVFLRKCDYVGMLPRKFNTAITAVAAPIVSFFGNDLFFAPSKKGDMEGFDLFVGGKNSHAARPLDRFVPPDRVVEVFTAVAELYRAHGPRSSRSKARLYHMLEAMGAEAFAQALDREVPGLSDGGEVRLIKRERDWPVPTGDGRFVHRYLSDFGRLRARQMAEIVALGERYGIEEIRLGCDQHLYLPGLPERITYERSHSLNPKILACVGARHCVYALSETKEESARLDSQKLSTAGLRVGFSGCLKGCARHAFADIGFVGIRTKLYGAEVERGVRLYLGAGYTRGERAGRLILYAVPMRWVNRMVDLIVDLYERSGYEDFERWALERIDAMSEPAIAFWLLYHLHRRHVVRRERWLALAKAPVGDEKAFFLRQLEATDEEDARIGALLRQEEAFAFREAIVYLERACFRKRKGKDKVK